MCEKCDTLFEILQGAAHANKLLISSELAINNGDIADCQKFSGEAQDLLKTLINDSFKEFFEKFSVPQTPVTTPDIPSNLEIAKTLSNLQFNLSIVLSFSEDTQPGTIYDSTLKEISKDINIITKLYSILYEN